MGLSTRVEALDIDRYRQLPSNVLAESLSSIEDLERKGWVVTSTPTIINTAYGKSLDFDGSADDLILTLSPMSNVTTSVTIILTVSSNNTGGFDKIFGLNDPDGTDELLLSTGGSGDDIYWQGTFGGGNNACGAGTCEWDASDGVKIGILDQFAITMTTNDVVAYLNGGSAITDSTADVPNMSNWTISLGASEIGGLNSDSTMVNLLIFNRVLSATEISDIYNGTTFDYWQDEVSHWDMSEINPQDIGWKGNANNGTGTGLVASTDLVNQGGDWGIEFNGSDEFVENNTQLVSAYPFTMTAEIKVQGNDLDDKAIFTLADVSESNVNYGIYLNGGGVRTFARNTDIEQGTQIPISSDGNFHSVVAVFTSATSRTIYLDGVAGTTDTDSVDYASGVDQWSIGRFGDSSPSSYFIGVIKDAKIYPTSLTTIQIEDLYVRGDH